MRDRVERRPGRMDDARQPLELLIEVRGDAAPNSS
jgi:hypothetical protein